MTDPSHEGGCLCGAIRYRISGEPKGVNLCHCQSCRRATGGPAVGFVDMPPGGFVWTAGDPAFYVSSPGVRRGFCPVCGTSLTYQADDMPGEMHVLSATLDDPSPWAPTAAYFNDERIAWLKVDLPDPGEHA
jgi:hypothetical protein